MNYPNVVFFQSTFFSGTFYGVNSNFCYHTVKCTRRHCNFSSNTMNYPNALFCCGTIFSGTFFSRRLFYHVTFFLGLFFPGAIFPVIFPRDLLSVDFLSTIFSFRGPFFSGRFYSVNSNFCYHTVKYTETHCNFSSVTMNYSNAVFCCGTIFSGTFFHVDFSTKVTFF